ncbi:PREDICTED: GDSL esterase/lipase At1g71250-like [Nelumbo nucifera]|uniref:GDSL esterase/lipase At1g71250-like n=1 Tax=Nelumbo nucifera TaxID=4432 RepID=A0A1U7ZBC1_NELNU|nr:PREDICTED: GDSL esterase/lipase At1g71250-like [Nelumbo nucifera]
MGGMNLLLHLVIFSAFGDVLGLVVGASLSAMFILGDSSVNCGYNHLYSFLDESALLYRCDGSQTSFLPDLLAEKMGLPEIPPFYGQNGTIEGLLGGLNFGSSPATIMNTGKLGFQSLNQQLRQASETLQLLQLQLGQDKAQQMINSSLFYLSFGKDDYVELFLHDISGLRHRFGAKGFAQVLVNQITRVIKVLSLSVSVDTE